MRTIIAYAWVIAAVVIPVGCGGGSNGSTTASPTNPTPTQAQPAVLQVGGQYSIVQQAATDTCGQTGQPIPVTATLTHTAGATAFVLADTGGTTFTGSVAGSGEFTASAVFGPDGSGQTYTQ